MVDVKKRRSLAVIPAIAAVIVLAACAAPEGQGKGDAANDAAAARFVTCLTGEGQTAKILEGGQVGMLMPDAPGDSPMESMESGSATLSTGEGENLGMTMVTTDEDGMWLASTTADGYPEDGGQREAWETCEKKVPEFSQPEPDISMAEGAKAFSAKDMIEASLKFAECARENGYADFADPDADGMLELPAGITEDEARELLTSCKDAMGEMPPAISQKSIEALDFDWFAVVSEFFKGGFMATTVVPAEGGE
ncbi:hypothetical protein ACFY5A_06245 [Microbacterium sp. NPDC012755]|uniref:hypothetical protein n=1 Tax=Microbacterium sp. NPDC012755 TaxID=3364184 RepID=UPI00368D81D8